MKLRIWPATLLLLSMQGCNQPSDIDDANLAVDRPAADPGDDEPESNLSDALNNDMAESANMSVMIGSAQGVVSGRNVDPDGGDGSDQGKGP